MPCFRASTNCTKTKLPKTSRLCLFLKTASKVQFRDNRILLRKLPCTKKWAALRTPITQRTFQWETLIPVTRYSTKKSWSNTKTTSKAWEQLLTAWTSSLKRLWGPGKTLLSRRITETLTRSTASSQAQEAGLRVRTCSRRRGWRCLRVCPASRLRRMTSWLPLTPLLRTPIPRKSRKLGLQTSCQVKKSSKIKMEFTQLLRLTKNSNQTQLVKCKSRT